MMVTQRDIMTEDEHILMVEVGNSFWYGLARLAADHIAMMPEDLESYVTLMLQEKCSIYGTAADELVPHYRAMRKVVYL